MKNTQLYIAAIPAVLFITFEIISIFCLGFRLHFGLKPHSL